MPLIMQDREKSLQQRTKPCMIRDALLLVRRITRGKLVRYKVEVDVVFQVCLQAIQYGCKSASEVFKKREQFIGRLVEAKIFDDDIGGICRDRFENEFDCRRGVTPFNHNFVWRRNSFY